MREETVKVYKFDELSDAAKAKAIEHHRQWNVDGFDWFDGVYGNWCSDDPGERDAFPFLGYEVGPKDIQFSGFWSQGDGASFTGAVDVAKWLACHPDTARACPHIVANAGDVSVAIIRTSHHYSHERTCTTEVEPNYPFTADEDETEAIDAEVSLLREAIEAERLDLCRKLYRQLQEEYEYLTSDEAVAESLRANDCEFTADGSDW